MKGILEGCILKIIGRRETYGYDIVSQLQDNGFTEAREGTLYPLLLRLEKKALITATYKPPPFVYFYHKPTGNNCIFVHTFFHTCDIIIDVTPPIHYIVFATPHKKRNTFS